MGKLREVAIGAGFSLLRATGLHRLSGDRLQGQGAILMFHHVRPLEQKIPETFVPNRLLEIAPAFLDAVILAVRRLGFEIVTLDEAVARIGLPPGEAARFAVFSFDDGYRDNLTYALPILKRQGVPFTLYITSGFADRRARLWWLELEEAVRRAVSIVIEIGGERILHPSGTAMEKSHAFNSLYRRLRAGPESVLLDTIGQLCAMHGVQGQRLVDEQCMDWDEIIWISREPLCTIGVHTETHPMLAKHTEAVVRCELIQSRAAIEARIGRPARHLAYPLGDPESAGMREFSIAAELGFASAVTTRPGMIFSAHTVHKTALPRLSINGRYQDITCVEALLTGTPFWVWNGGRMVNVG